MFLQSQVRPISHSPYEPSLHHIETSYNQEIMALQLNIAHLNSQLITLRRSLYEANPHIDIAKLLSPSPAPLPIPITPVTSTNHCPPHNKPVSNYSPQIYKPTTLKSSQYSQSCLAKSIIGNGQGRMIKTGMGAGWKGASRAQSANRSLQMKLGERITGRRCVWGDPFGQVEGCSIQ